MAAGQIAAQQWFAAPHGPLDQWRHTKLTDFESYVIGCDDMAARLVAWQQGFEHGIEEAERDLLEKMAALPDSGARNGPR
ncbi:MAG: hypothetical protein EPN46_02455 [Candidimonas sp.]|nr:MAG: hypothetical protein EPN77_05335 [Candidimonas sp.]TAM22306.1 MAG: hypothetical protein EPN62_12305 [Candidimonas sp.]TAM80194.1 MAG: hypothetical protein EPN46_02455 [Candidimonas sp.]